MTTLRYSSFSVGGLLLGINVEQVQEVVRGLHITPVPLAHPSIAGLINLRGLVITAIDARILLQLHTPALQNSDCTGIIVTSRNEQWGLVIDKEGDVIDVDSQDQEEVPETVSAVIRSCVTGAYQLDSALLLAIDPDDVISLATT